MKLKFVGFFILFCMFFLSCKNNSSAIEIKGDTTSYEGYTIIKVWGSHYERGYAYGYLLVDKFIDVLENYLIKVNLSNNLNYFNEMKTVFQNNYELEDKYLDEGQGILDGIIASGKGFKLNEVIGHTADKYDVLCGNVIVEFAFLGCSSISAWGEKTITDTELKGELVYTRNLDWTKSSALVRNNLLTIQFPSEKDEQPWLSFGYPGLTGILSGINFSGVGAFHHMGNIGNSDVSKKPHSIFYSIRNGIESMDYNNDGISNTNDVFLAIKDKQTQGGFIVNCVNSIAHNDSAIVVEVNNLKGTVARFIEDKDEINGSIIASTNHFLKLYPKVSCSRYDKLVNILMDINSINSESEWQILSDAAGVSYTLQTIQYIPALGKIKWAVADNSTPAYKMTPVELNLLELLTTNVAVNQIEQENISIFPNPATNSLKIEFSSIESDFAIITIYSVSGKNIYEDKYQISENRKLTIPIENYIPGLYFCRIILGSNESKEQRIFVQKFVIAK